MFNFTDNIVVNLEFTTANVYLVHHYIYINQEIHNSLKMYKISESSKFETSEKFTRFHEDFKVQQGISRFHENLAIILRVLTDFKTSPEILE